VTKNATAIGQRPLLSSFRRVRLNVWSIGTLIVAGLASIPIIAVLAMALTPQVNIWPHLASTVLPHYILTTLILMTGVGLGTLIIGTGCAWLVTMCRFPGRRMFEWALLLPMAVPAYIVAYVYTDLLEFAGPVQETLRDLFGWKLKSEYWFPEIRSTGGAALMMTLAFYPYVYLLSRAAFLEQSVGVLEVGRTLGRGPWRGFFLIALPLARPAIIVGLTLVLMETLNDFGTVDYFAVATFTAGIFDVWLNMNNVGGAAQLATVLLIFVLVLIYLERRNRSGQRYHSTTTKVQTLPGYRLTGLFKFATVLACCLPVLFGFVLPAGILLNYAVSHYSEALDANLIAFTLNSLMLASAAALICVFVGGFMAYGARLDGSVLVKSATRFASLGYAVPGAVLAIGVIIPTAWLDNSVDAIMRDLFGIPTGLILSGTIIAVTIGYVVRFLALSFGTVEASLANVTQNMDGAARTLGHGPAQTFVKVHMPLIRGSILTAAILVFVDTMKELPMTIILRPFNFQTLATFVHQYASDELLEESALAALIIVAAGILPVILLSRTIGRSRPGTVAGEPV
jgi:iron(III) transport system permease protein